MTKLGNLNGYIARCTRAIESKDLASARDLQKEIIAVYENEIQNITSGLDNYSWTHMYDTTQVDYVGDLTLLKAKLSNYRENIKAGALSNNNSKSPIIINSNSNASAQSNATNQISITFEQTIRDINSLPNEILSSSEKEELEDKLSALEIAVNSKNKEKIGTKLMSLLNFIVTKGPEVALATSKFIAFISDKVLPLFNK